MFRNHLISGERSAISSGPCNRSPASFRQAQELDWHACRGRRRKRRTYQKRPCRSEISKQRGILVGDRDRDQGAVRAGLETGAKIIFALVVGAEIAAQQGRLADMVDVLT